MSAPELEKYITAAREQRVPDDQIKTQLIKIGWSQHEVDEAFTPAPSTGINLPPPPVPHFGMWVAFQYIIMFISLYLWSTGLAGFLHYWVGKFFEDKLDSLSYSYNFGRTVSDALLPFYGAILLVGFPIFAFLFLSLRRQAIQKPALKSLRARKILIYITLVGTFLIMIGHVIGTLIGFLSGSSETQSFAHLGVTFLVAGSIFVYLLNEVKEDRKT